MNLPRLRIIWAIARHELRIVLRSRWVLAYGAILGVLTLAVSYFGLTVIEFTGFQDFGRTTASLLNLVLYIVPLATMLMAVQSFRAEGGATDQLFAEPISVAEIVLGKVAGLSITHALATFLGFSFTGILIGLRVGSQGITGYITLIGFTILVGVVFLTLATMLAIVAGRGVRTYAVVLVTWFASVLIFDLVIIGLSFLLPEMWANRIALAGVFLNPIDATRVGTLLVVAGREMFGPGGAVLVRSVGGVTQAVTLLGLALVIWIVWPTTAAIYLLERRDI